jgi:hypothetical protein
MQDAAQVYACIELLWWCSEAATSCTRSPATPGNMDIIARKDALAQGLTHYFTGKPCKRGHVAARYAKTGNCVECTLNIFNKRPYEPTPEQQERYRQRNKEYQRQRRSKMTDQERKEESQKRSPYILQYVNARRDADSGFKLRMNLRHRIWSALQASKASKSGGIQQLVGCSAADLMKHLETQFTDGMSWDNYGRDGWHIDHIRPCASFDLSDPKQQRQCFHYTNLQPLWAADNIKKGAKW